MIIQPIDTALSCSVLIEVKVMIPKLLDQFDSLLHTVNLQETWLIETSTKLFYEHFAKREPVCMEATTQDYRAVQPFSLPWLKMHVGRHRPSK